jgi:hypothetical protein
MDQRSGRGRVCMYLHIVTNTSCSLPLPLPLKPTVFLSYHTNTPYLSHPARLWGSAYGTGGPIRRGSRHLLCRQASRVLRQMVCTLLPVFIYNFACTYIPHAMSVTFCKHTYQGPNMPGPKNGSAHGGGHEGRKRPRRGDAGETKGPLWERVDCQWRR